MKWTRDTAVSLVLSLLGREAKTIDEYDVKCCIVAADVGHNSASLHDCEACAIIGCASPTDQTDPWFDDGGGE